MMNAFRGRGTRLVGSSGVDSVDKSSERVVAFGVRGEAMETDEELSGEEGRYVKPGTFRFSSVPGESDQN